MTTRTEAARSTVKIAIPGSTFWGVIFFALGLIIYQDLFTALMLGLFAWLATVLCLLFIIPIACIPLFICATWIWDWPAALASALQIPEGALPAVAWFVPAIMYFIIGIILTIFAIAAIVVILADLVE